MAQQLRALQDSRLQRQKLMQLYIKQMPTQGRPLLAVDQFVKGTGDWGLGIGDWVIKREKLWCSVLP